MKSDNILALFLAVVLVSPCFSVEPCVQVSPCSCESSEGLIDLSPLARHDGTPEFVEQPDVKGQWFYSYNPCFAFTNGGGCTNVAACQTDMTGSYFSLGTEQSAVFMRDPNNNVQIRYTSTTDTTRTTFVTLICDPNSVQNLTVLGEYPDGSGTYHFTLTSIYACPRGQTTTTTTTTTTASPTPAPRPAPTPSPSPFFTMKTVIILLGCVIGCLFILICLAFVGLLTRRSEQELPPFHDKRKLVS
ncbi:uncharacterized protein LOC124148687 [Haliotis rufescens]|uniref:uncharacterized protein LOC124148687 n=1 Tax=Haliotis rufescens TaxID=6454 RepID=UPI00201F460F|nr:uncharacterized protein LOC124148687 [Haliotis rufescens]